MSNDIVDLLVAHEIGHALYTKEDDWKSALDEGLPHSFLNVIEDARIEKLVKRKYPGIVRSFVNGYRELIDNNFFGTKDKDVNQMLLIDRLNMHFKTSIVKSDVEFTTAEQLIVKKMENLETFNDVVVLARELSEYCKDEAETKGLDQHDMADTEDYDDEDSDYQDSDSDNTDNNDEDSNESGKSKYADDDSDDNEDSDSDNDGDTTGQRGQQNVDEGESTEYKPSAETDNYWEDNKDKLIDDKCKNNAYTNIHQFKNIKEFVIDYKRVLSDFKSARLNSFRDDRAYGSSYRSSYPTLIAEYKKFQRSNSKSVNYMVKEFEMKKAATAYTRSKQDKSGVVDPLKLHSYKYNDDIFKRLTITPDGKNHGMMMFIDWSGSMSDKLTPTIHQLMNLVMFCRKVNIPYEVYAFSNSGRNGRYHGEPNIESKKPKYQPGDLTIDPYLKLINFASSRMTAKEHEEAMSNLYGVSIKYEDYMGSRRFRRSYEVEENELWKSYVPDSPQGYGLSSTPLNCTIAAAMTMVPQFQNKYSIDKMNTIFLTDGCSDGNEYMIISKEEAEEMQELNSGRWGTDENNNYYTTFGYDDNIIIRNKSNKENYLCSSRRDGMTESLLQALKDHTGTSLTGFFISGSKRIDRYTLDKYFPQYNYGGDEKVFDRKKVMAEFRKNKCLVVNDNTGYDEFYLLAGDDMKVTDGQMATPSDNAKKGEIKRLFTQNLKSNRSSRIVMNKFITQVA
tara:strand:+ start:25 stop:2220 length:2196 start_codon:yes stop_codon:yes gene_type:complete